jgi:hypothetical protein
MPRDARLPRYGRASISRRSAGSTSAANYLLRVIHPALRQDGWGRGTVSANANGIWGHRRWSVRGICASMPGG